MILLRYQGQELHLRISSAGELVAACDKRHVLTVAKFRMLRDRFGAKLITTAPDHVHHVLGMEKNEAGIVKG